MRQVVYDLETYPNYFLLGLEWFDNSRQVFYEISDYRDDRKAMFKTLRWLAREQVEMVGFNSISFDYPVLHHLIRNEDAADLAYAAYQKAEMIIRGGDRFAHMIWPSDRFIPQLDLFKLNHFDNVAKSTSLKSLQFAMRSESVEDLPIAPGTSVTAEEAQQLTKYCGHDITETKRFAVRCAPEIEFRRALVASLGSEVMNWSDVKIGSEFLIQRIGKEHCYYRDKDGKRQPRQTERYSIPVSAIVFPYIAFDRRECRDLLARFKATTIYNTKSAVSDAVELDGFTFVFGTGGIHGSADKRAFHASADRIIVDADVTSLYPSIAIENNLAPEHLGARFTVEYAKLKAERLLHAKNTPPNKMIKLALNGTYGNTNNGWSCFLDAQVTMAITINGQLTLLMLAERLLAAVPGIELIQINTDGVTASMPPGSRVLYDAVCRQWERETKLALEYADYRSFFCRDVNNYIAVTTAGKAKRKGAYEFPETDADYNGWWHKDYSALAIQRAVSAALVDGADIEATLRANRDPFDFMLRYKTKGDSKLMHGDAPMSKTTRYYQSVAGLPLVKESPPVDGAKPGDFKRKNGLTDAEYFKIRSTVPAGTWDERIHTKNRSVYGERRMQVSGSADICNRADAFDRSRLDYDWYVAEARKLVDCFTSS